MVFVYLYIFPPHPIIVMALSDIILCLSSFTLLVEHKHIDMPSYFALIYIFSYLLTLFILLSFYIVFYTIVSYHFFYCHVIFRIYLLFRPLLIASHYFSVFTYFLSTMRSLPTPAPSTPATSRAVVVWTDQ